MVFDVGVAFIKQRINKAVLEHKLRMLKLREEEDVNSDKKRNKGVSKDAKE